jgi:hypothetical protein
MTWSLIGPVLCLFIIGTSTVVLVTSASRAESWLHWTGSRWSWWLAALSGLSWIGLASIKRSVLNPRAVMVAGLALLALAACTIERYVPGHGWGYRALIMLWAAPAGLCLLPVTAAARLKSLPAHWAAATYSWSRIGVGLALLMGLRAAFQL